MTATQLGSVGAGFPTKNYVYLKPHFLIPSLICPSAFLRALSRPPKDTSQPPGSLSPGSPLCLQEWRLHCGPWLWGKFVLPAPGPGMDSYQVREDIGQDSVY